MSFRFRQVTLDTIGVVGSGQIGPDIALSLAQALQPHGVGVVVVDLAPEALARGRAKLDRKIAQARERGGLTEAAAGALVNAVQFTTEYGRLAGAGLVIEAATERLEIKRGIFERLEAICGESAVLASNSSHLEPERIFSAVRRRDRTLVIHYFYPAERNPLVEVVTDALADPGLADWVMALYEALGKVPIRVGSRYGYAVNPVFEGLFLAAALAVEEGLGTTREVDAAAARALGLGVGPFTAMNLTGGNPITHHALDEMTTRLGRWFRSPALLRDAMAASRPWDVSGRGETVTLAPERERAIADAMQGAYFGLAGKILDCGIVRLADLEVALELGLAIRPPFAAMNAAGPGRALALVEAYAAAHPGFEVPRCLAAQARSGRAGGGGSRSGLITCSGARPGGWPC